MQLIILAAGKSSRIFKNIKKNKCLIKIKKKTLIEKIIQESISVFKKINVITGYKSHLIRKHLNKFPNINIIHNKEYNSTDMLHSMILGLNQVNDDVVISYSDILVSNKIWKIFKKIKNEDILLPIKKNWKSVWKIRSKLYLDDAESLKVDKNKFLIEIGGKIKKNSRVDGQFMGLIYISKKMIKSINNLYKKHKLKNTQTTQFLNLLLKKNFIIKCRLTNLFWYEIDDIVDLKNLNKVKHNID